MGREVRKVKEGWEHPKRENGRYEPLMSGYAEDYTRFMEILNKDGLQAALDEMSAPDINNYMPEWTDEEKTMLMMYEDTSEGTPISPAFKTPEELARWLADNNASAFGDMTATYEQWLSMCNRGWAMSAVYDTTNGMQSGVAALT